MALRTVEKTNPCSITLDLSRLGSRYLQVSSPVFLASSLQKLVVSEQFIIQICHHVKGNFFLSPGVLLRFAPGLQRLALGSASPAAASPRMAAPSAPPSGFCPGFWVWPQWSHSNALELLALSDGDVSLSIMFAVRDATCHDPAPGNPLLLENYFQKLITACCEHPTATWHVLCHTDPADSPRKTGRLPGDL